MALQDELLSIEQALWSGEAEPYREHLDSQCLVAFTEMAGQASAARGEEERYRALVSSGYVKRDGAWKMMFHQQTPLAG